MLAENARAACLLPPVVAAYWHSAALPQQSRALVCMSADSSQQQEYVIDRVELGDEPDLQVCVYTQEKHYRNNLLGSGSASLGDATGGRLSSAARVGTWYLAALRNSLRTHAVLELGCGAAPTGVYAARHAAAVTLTDADDGALHLAAKSARLDEAMCRAPPRIAKLPWGERFAREADEHISGLPMACPLLVLGCDLVYYASGVPELMWTISHLLQRGQQQGGTGQDHGSWAVLTFTPRLAGWMQALHDAAVAAGLRCGHLPVSALLPAGQLETGRFGNTRLALLWLQGVELPPAAAAGQALTSSQQLLAEAAAEEAAAVLPFLEN